MSPNAREPQTDREYLIQISDHVTQLREDVQDIKKDIKNKTDNDFCDRQHVVIEKRLLDHSKRITGLEQFRWYVMGAFAIAVVIITALIQILR